MELYKVIELPASEIRCNILAIRLVFIYLVPHVKQAEDWFADGEVIVGELNEIYPIRILGNGRNEGTNTVNLYAA